MVAVVLHKGCIWYVSNPSLSRRSSVRELASEPAKGGGGSSWRVEGIAIVMPEAGARW